MKAPPPGSVLRVVSGPPGLVVAVPRGAGRAGFLFWFALLWNLAALPAAGLFVLAAAQNGVAWDLDPPPNPGGGTPVSAWTLPFVAVFPLVGLGLAAVVLNIRFRRLVVLAEPGRVALRTELFGLRRTRVLAVGPGDRAALEVAEEDEDAGAKRYRVRVGGRIGGRRRGLGFGFGLPEGDLRWLRDEINAALAGRGGG